MNIQQVWREHFAGAAANPFYRQIKSEPLPRSDWAEYSPEKVDDFLKAVLASFALVEKDGPFSTLETGVFAGGTSAVFLHALGVRSWRPAMHVGIDPYFLLEQSYPEYQEHYGIDPQLMALQELSAIARRVSVPYVPFFMSSARFIQNDLLPCGFNFRVFHLDGDHRASAVFDELTYFSARVSDQAIFLLDDIGEGFPGVEEAIRQFCERHPNFQELASFSYVTRAGKIGFGVYHWTGASRIRNGDREGRIGAESDPVVENTAGIRRTRSRAGTRSNGTIVMSGMIAADPWQGGATWAVLQYLLGFERLGFDVCLIESIEANAVRLAGRTLADSENASYFNRVMAEFGLEKRAAMLLAGTQQTVGLSYASLVEITRRADVLINISGLLQDEALFGAIPTRVYLDLDPAFNQLWSVVEGIDMRFAGHTHFVTIGQALGDADCPIPTGGIPWLKTFQPVVLERWPVIREPPRDVMTTVANWRGYGSIQHEGILYGQKVHSLREFADLPQQTDQVLELALAIHPGETRDLERLHRNGWRMVDPRQVTSTPAAYQEYVQQSKAEFGIAKSGYVLSRCGWFSDRSLCYLASGRPVIAQETGFSRFIRTGSGLFAFQSLADVLGAVQELRVEYNRHCKAARLLAEEYFDSDRVLTQLFRMVTARPSGRSQGASSRRETVPMMLEAT